MSRTNVSLTTYCVRILSAEGPALCGALAFLVGLPALKLPFLADDWINLAKVVKGVPAATPFGYVRPVYLATYRFDGLIWGRSPALFHLTNLLLISVCAALVVIVIRRYTGDPVLAGLAGLFFALHPYHVENAAWIAARSDPIFMLFFLLAMLAYERWRHGLTGVPVLALGLFEAALLSKEAAIALPGVLVLVGVFDRSRRAGREEWLRGYLPLMALGLIHFVWVRPALLNERGWAFPTGFGVYSLQKASSYFAAILLPAHTEILEQRPFWWAGVAAAAAGVLLAGAWAGSSAIPRVVWGFGLIWLVLLVPSILSFQERYFFLPSAASGAILAALLCAGRRRVSTVAGTLILAGWCLSAVDHWRGWSQAGWVSRRLVEGLVEASRREGAKELVVANMPHRVRGAPVAGHFASAVALSGGRSVKVSYATYIDYPTATAETLDGPWEISTQRSPPPAEVRLRVTEGNYSRCVWPPPRGGGKPFAGAGTSVLFQEEDRILVRIEPRAGGELTALVWTSGKLQRLF